MHSVAGGAVDDGRVGDVLAVVDEDGPDVDEGEEGDVGELLQREQEREDVVGQALREAVQRVEGVAGEGRGHDPLVVRLVQGPVHLRVVQPAVDPVDAKVREEHEDGELQPVVQREGRLRECVVELTVPAHFRHHQGRGEERHAWHRGHGLLDLHADLVLEEFGVLEGVLVEDEEVGKAAADEVDDYAEEPVALCVRRCNRENKETFRKGIRGPKLTRRSRTS